MSELLKTFDGPDPELDEVEAYLRRIDPTGEHWAAVVRRTYDMIYNGAETGRYRWDQLAKTEKTHFGTLFEINAQREFEFDDGSGDPDDAADRGLDYNIVGHDVDAKWSQDDGRWMLPPEVFGKLALVATGSDPKSEFSIGLIRVRPEYLTTKSKGNRDKKSWLSADGREYIHWIWRHAPMPPSVLLQLPESVVNHIVDNDFGTKRIDRLFRATEGMPVHRTTVRTVAKQLDDQKRVRSNGGARSSLAPEGYIILSGKYHAFLAEGLGVAVPNQLQYVSVRVVPAVEREPGAMVIAGRWWRKAQPNEAITEPAPKLPDRGVRE